jgi:2-methylcitrate dehydratase PrpD
MGKGSGRTTRRAFVVGAATGLAAASDGRAAEPSLSQSLATAVMASRGTPVPPEVLDRTIWTVIDCLGAMIFAAGTPEVAMFMALVRSRPGRPTARVLGTGVAAAVEYGAAGGAFLIHANEIDDGDMRSQLRASAVIMSTALALADALDQSGPAFLRSAALGYTLQGRLAAAQGPTQGRGWMASGVWGPPAAAAMAADALGLGADQIASALALAASASGGSFQYFHDQTEEKRLVVARAARSAVEAAFLAKAGEVGARHILEGPAGLYRLFGGAEGTAPAAEVLAGDLDRLEGPLFIHPKFFAASQSIIPTLDGIAADLPDIDAAGVDGFTVRGGEAWAVILADKINRFEPPLTRIGAMMNFSYVLALVMVRGAAMPDDYRTLPDAAVVAFARKGRFELDPTAAVPRIDFRMKDGRILTSLARYPGLRDIAPLDAGRRLAKFEALTRRIGAARQSALLAACRALPREPSMRRWITRVQRLAG